MKKKSYVDDSGEEVFVSAGLGGDTFMSMRRRPSGSMKRVKSPRLPVRDNIEDAQDDLDKYAKLKGWTLYNRGEAR